MRPEKKIKVKHGPTKLPNQEGRGKIGYAAIMKALESSIPEVIQRFQGNGEEDINSDFGDGMIDFDVDNTSQILRDKKKRVRPTAAELR